MIQAVTFDLWGTLILDSEHYDSSLQKKRIELIHNALGGKITSDFIMKALDESWSQISSIRSTLKDVPTAEQVRILEALLPTKADLNPPYTEAILHVRPSLNLYARSVLAHIPVKVGLISNTGRTPGEVLRIVLSDLGILHLFDATIFSNEVGYLKPDQRIFQYTSSQLGVPLSDILHVGDDMTADIAGAAQVGMQTLLVETPADLLKVKEILILQE